MLRRLGWIAASYFTRPLILTIVALGLLFLVSTGLDSRFNPRYGTDYPQAPGAHLTINSTATLEAVRREGKQAEVDAIDLNALWTDMHYPQQPSNDPQMRVIEDYGPPGEAFYDVLEELPNLRFVHVDFAGSNAGTRQLARLSKLEYLFVNGAPPPDFDWIRPLNRLSRLELGVYSPPHGLAALAALPHLKTIVLRHPFEVDDAVLDALAGLPHLQLLVLDFGYLRLGDKYMYTKAGLSALARSQSLETVYAGGLVPPDRAALLKMARRALPQMDVQPAVAQAMPIALICIMPFGFFAAAIGLGLSDQFRGPQSRLAPKYGVSHALVAGLFFAAVVAAGAVTLIAAGYDPLAATVVCMAVAAVTIFNTSADLQTTPADRPRQVRLVDALRAVMFMSIVVLLFVPRYIGAILSGVSPWPLVVIGLIAVVALALTARSLQGRLNRPATPRPIDGASFRRQMLWRGQFGSGWVFGLTRAERTIDAWTGGKKRWTWWRRVQRWRLGNAPFRPTRFMLMMLASFAIVIPLFVWVFHAPATALGIRGGTLVVFSVVLLLGAAGQVAGAWRARMLMLSTEALRPYRRRAMQTEMAAAFVLDMVPPALFLAAIGAVGTSLDAGWHMPWARLGVDFSILAIVSLCVTVGLGSVMVVVNRDWMATVVATGALLVTVVGMSGLTALQFENGAQLYREFSSNVVLPQSWLPMVVGVVLACAMWRRWLTMEMGSRA